MPGTSVSHYSLLPPSSKSFPRHLLPFFSYSSRNSFPVLLPTWATLFQRAAHTQKKNTPWSSLQARRAGGASMYRPQTFLPPSKPPNSWDSLWWLFLVIHTHWRPPERKLSHGPGSPPVLVSPISPCHPQARAMLVWHTQHPHPLPRPHAVLEFSEHVRVTPQLLADCSVPGWRYLQPLNQIS